MNKNLFFHLGMLACAFSITAKNQPSVKLPEPQQKITFTENKGQVSDQHAHARPDVLFGGSANGLVYHLRKNGISYQLSRENEAPSSKDENIIYAGAKEELVSTSGTIYRLDLNWVNANPHFSIRTDEALPGHATYYLPVCPQGAQNVRTYTGVTYVNIYDRIDLHYYEKDGALKYDYLVAPYADYSRIRIQIKGTDKITLQKDGSIILQTPLGDIKEEAPLVYQNGKELKSHWIITNTTLSFGIEGYDNRYPMVIDPVLRLWGTYYGDSGEDRLTACAADAFGNIIGGGRTASSGGTVIATTGAYQTSIVGLADAFVVKFNNSGVRQWATYYGGSFTDYTNGFATDASGNIFMCGETESSDLSSTAGSHQPASGGNSDGYLAKFNASGTLQWATYYGGATNDRSYACATDPSGNVIITGATTGAYAAAFTTPGSHQPAGANSNTAYLAKFDGNGVRQWGTFYGGPAAADGNGCATDASGNIYMCGSTASVSGTFISTPGSHQSVFGGGFVNDAFLVKFDAAGVRQWGTFYGGDDIDSGLNCSTDAGGNIYMAGTSSSTAGIASPGAHQTTKAGSGDSYLVKFNTNGVRQWGTYYGGAQNELNAFCSTDLVNGNVYLVGTTTSFSGIATSDAFQTTYSNNDDMFMAQFSGTGTNLYGTYYGNTATERVIDCATDIYGSICFVGYAYGAGIASAGAHQTTHTGNMDGFMTLFGSCAVPTTPTNTSISQTVCSGKSATLSASSTGSVGWYATAVSTTTLSATADYVTSSTLAAGVYTYYAEATSCANTSARTAITLTVEASPTISLNSGSICSGQSFTFSPSGAASYTYTGGSAIVSPVSTQNYTVTGTSAAGCANTGGTVATVTVNATPTITVNSGTICAGQAFTITPSGASAYTIQGGSTIVNPSTDNTYSVTGSSAEGCRGNTVVSSVTVYSLPVVSVNSGTVCSGQSFTLIPSGANTYTYSGGSNVINPTGPTSTYSVSGTSAQGCVSSASAVSTVTVYSTPSISVNSGTICSGNSFTMVPSGALTYTFSNGSDIVTPSVGTNYSVTGTSTAGCISAAAISSITVNITPTISVNSGTICSGKSFTMVPSGALTYTFSNGSDIVSPIINASYSLTGSNAAGCISNIAISNVTVYTTPTITVNSGAICQGSSFTLTAAGANSYTYQGGSTTVSPATNSTYTVTGTSTQGCTGNTAISTVSVNPLPVVSVPGPSVICNNTTAILNAGGAVTYTWIPSANGASISVSPQATTSYTVAGTDANGCVNTTIKTITVNTAPVLLITGNNEVCLGSSVSQTVSGAVTYSWSTGSLFSVVSLTPAATTVYTVSGTDLNNCTSAIVKVITVNALPVVTANANSTLVCAGSSVTLSGGGASTYTWTGGVNDNVAFYPTLSSGYTVTGTDVNGCRNQAMVSLVIAPAPALTVSSSNATLCAGEEAILTASGGNTYSWNTGQSTSSIPITPTITSTYTVTGTASNGCTASVVFTQTVSCTVGIYSVNKAGAISLRVYPNPGTGHYTVETDQAPVTARLDIYTVLGQLIYSSMLSASVTAVDLQQFSDGIYVLQISDHGKVLDQRKLIKQ